MLKHRIHDIYKDSSKLFSTNTLITNDDRLSFMSEDLDTFDLIAKYDFGAREILTQFLDDEDLDYKLNDIHEAIYMNMLKNLRKYLLFYKADEAGNEVIPSYDYKITREYGEEEKHFNYGEKTVTETLGDAEQTITTAPRSKDSQDQRTTFDSTDDFDTTHNVTGTIQTVDTIEDAQKINTEVTDEHSDGVVYDEHTDNVFGYKSNPTKNIETFRKYLNDNTIKTIVAECINTVTYSIYMYTGQM